MKRKLSWGEFWLICLSLFAMFFGAGNFIFPPIVGKNAGENFYVGIMFFCLTAVLLPVLGVAALARAKGLRHLVNRVDPIFGVIFIVLLYLSIGPLFAIPRAANMPFDIAIRQYVGNDIQIWLFVYLVIYFGLNYYICLNPTKLVDILGRYLTPILLILIIALFVAALIHPMGDFGSASGGYVKQAAASGFIDGYQTMDALASLAFGIIVINSIKGFGIKNENYLVLLAIKTGIVAGAILFVIYLALGYVGATSANLFVDIDKNGALLLSNISKHLFGSIGIVVLGSAFLLACLTTTIGLITSASEYFAMLTNDKIKYKFWVFLWCLIGFGVANFGLESIINTSLPVLIAIYPVAIILIILSLIDNIIEQSKLIYRACVYLCAFIGVLNGLDGSNISIPLFTGLVRKLPFYDQMLGWVIPSIIVFCITFMIRFILKRKNI